MDHSGPYHTGNEFYCNKLQVNGHTLSEHIRSRTAKLTDVLNKYSVSQIFGSRKYSLLYSNKSNVQDYLFGHMKYSLQMVL